MKVVLPVSDSRPCLDRVWGTLLEIGDQWWTVGGWLDREVFQNCKGYQDDKKVLGHIIGQLFLRGP